VLVGRNQERFSVPGALFWALSWGVGAALGVALGGWLTLVGGSGSPGAAGLDALVDLGVLPGGALIAVTLVHLAGQLFAAVLRGRAVERGQAERDQQRAEDDGIVG